MLSSFRIQPLRLDHIDAHIPDRLIAHELDSAGRILRVQLTDGGDVRDTTGTSLSLAWKHQRGASGLEPFSVADAATGVYEVTYPSAMMLDGVATCSIQVIEGSSIAATRNFHVRIQDAPIDGDATASTETWTSLQLILTQGQAAVTALEEQHTEQATAHDAQMQQQASEFSTAQSTRETEFTDALTDYQAQVDAAAASATEVYIGTGTPPENAVLWIDTTDGGKRVKSLVDGQWVEPTAEVMRPLDADTIAGGIGGRNLVLDSDRVITSDAFLVMQGRLSEPWVEGATYTVTVKGSVNTPNHFGLWRDRSSTHAAHLTEYDSERGVYSATFVCPPPYPGRDPHEFAIYNVDQATATSASIEWIKIERGSVATDWTVAPERNQRAEPIPDGTDLNNITVPGIYLIYGNRTYANNPIPGSYAFLEVTANASGATVRQVTSDSGRRRYERWYGSGSWDAWTQVQPII